MRALLFQEDKVQRPPKPDCCMAFLEMSLVEEMPCMRSLKSSALEALSIAVS